jgi:hypothetical protein
LQKWALDPGSARALRHSRPGDTGRAASEGGGVVGVGVPEKGRDGDGDGDEVTQSRWWKRGSSGSGGGGGGGGGGEKVAPP